MIKTLEGFFGCFPLVAVAVTLAAADPGRVASLTLIAPVGLGEEIDTEFIDGFVTVV